MKKETPDARDCSEESPSILKMIPDTQILSLSVILSLLAFFPDSYR